MKTLKQIVEEKNNWKNADEFIEIIKKDYLSHFPNGYIDGIAKRSIGEPHIVINYGLIASKKDLPSGYRDNDPMNGSIMIHANAEDFNGNKLQLSPLKSGLYVNPPEGSYLAMSSVKTGLRKKTSNLAGLEKHLKNFFKKLVVIVKENEENIYGYEKYDKKYFKVK